MQDGASHAACTFQSKWTRNTIMQTPEAPHCSAPAPDNPTKHVVKDNAPARSSINVNIQLRLTPATEPKYKQKKEKETGANVQRSLPLQHVDLILSMPTQNKGQSSCDMADAETQTHAAKGDQPQKVTK